MQRRQRRNPPPVSGKGDIAISFRNLTSSSVTVDFAAEDKTGTYYFSIIPASDFASYASDDELIRGAVASLESLAALHDRDLRDLLAEELRRGNTSRPYEGLTPQTVYVAFAFGLTTECEVTSALSKAEFTTLSPESVPCTFDLSAEDVTATSLTLHVDPSDNGVAYYFDMMSAQQYAAYCGGSSEGVPSFVTDLYLPSLADQYGLTVAEVVSDIASHGPVQYAFSGLSVATDYYAFAIGLAADGSTTTAPAVERFRTAGAAQNTFDVRVTDRGADWADVRVTPLNDEPYLLIPELQEYFEGMNDEEIIDEVLRAYARVLAERTYYGVAQVRESNLVPDRDYWVLVFGYDNGVPTTPLMRQAFRTNKSVPVDCTFSLAVKEVGKTTVKVGVTPSDEAVSYFSYYVPAARYEAGGGDDAAVRTYTDEVIDELVRHNEGWPRCEVLQAILARGSGTWTLDEGSLTPATDYYAYAVGMTADGTFTTPPVLSERFTTLGEHETLARIEIDYMMMDGSGYGHPDDALIYGWFYPKNANIWYGAGFVDDDSVLAWSDDEAAAYLLENGETGAGSSGSIWHYVPWGGHINYLGIAVDEEGYHSPVARLSVTADRSSLASARAPEMPGDALMRTIRQELPRTDAFLPCRRADTRSQEPFRSRRELHIGRTDPTAGFLTRR